MSIDIKRLNDPDYWDAVAPEGATHYWHGEFLRWLGKIQDGMPSLDVWDDNEWTVNAYGLKGGLIDLVSSGAIDRPTVSPASLISDAQAEKLGSGQKHDAQKTPPLTATARQRIRCY